MFCGCSDRTLGFSGYNDDNKETVANPATATVTAEAELRRIDRPITSDVNRNPLKSPQPVLVDSTSAGQSSNGKYKQLSSETKAHDRRDENYVGERRDTPSQVLQLSYSAPVQYQINSK